MNRVAIFVDAGYFFAQSSVALTGDRKTRGQGELQIKKLMEALEKFAIGVTKSQLLRIYWYDGTATGPSPEHIAIANEANVKLRLGFVNAVGQQKGVDSLIITDMISLARNRAMSDAILLSGDEDLRVGVQQAQEFGVRVHLLGIASHPNYAQKSSQSQFLLQEADTTDMWTSKELSGFLAYKANIPAPKFEQNAAPASARGKLDRNTEISEIARQYASEIDQQHVGGLVGNYQASKQIPPDIDRPLLGRAKTQLGTMSQDEKSKIREHFVNALKERMQNPPDIKSG